jgi:hypothetical protein
VAEHGGSGSGVARVRGVEGTGRAAAQWRRCGGGGVEWKRIERGRSEPAAIVASGC